MTALPEGTLTLLFSDIEGSTRLLARLGERYGEVLSAQRAVLRTAFAAHGGHEMGTEGDSFFVVFETVGAAVRAALAGQRGLAEVAWPDGAAVRVRMGLHTGEPVRHEDGYVGMDVHRAARVAAVAHGGQVLLTAATQRIAQSHRDVELLDLGEHRLKDLPAPEHLYQLCGPGLERVFPPVRSLGSRATLPLPATAMVGRSTELTAVTQALTDPMGGVLTLTGPGGVGKTRLALAAAAALEPRFSDGVYFVAGSAVRSAEVLWTSVADAVGAESKDPASLLQHLSDRRVLLVLDNLEQVPDGAEVTARLTGAGPGLRVLVTSRRPLHVDGERELPVTPLSLPTPGEDAATAAGTGAVALFVQRAGLVRPGFALTEGNVEDVAEICRALDGLPLAIELVASRAKLLAPRALRTHLDQVLELGHTTVGAPDRQRTLRATISWSYDLLGPELQEAFMQLSVFAGWFDLPAVPAVVGRAGEDPARGLEELAELVDANLLLVRDGPDGEPRFRMLRTIATFGREMLTASGHEHPVRRRHAQHYLALAEEVRAQLRSPQHLTARDRVESELDNVRGALAWAFAEDDTGLGLRLCEQLSWFWYACGYQEEGRRWLRVAVAAAGDQDSPELARTRHGLAVLVLQHGQAEQARDLLRQALGFWRQVGDSGAVASELNSLALAHRALGESDVARSLLEEAVGAARQAPDAAALADALSNRAALEIDAGRYDEAVVLLQEVLELDTAAGDAWGIAADHVNLAGALLRADRAGPAAALLQEHGRAAAELGDAELTVSVLELYGVLHARAGDARRAARALGAAQALRTRAGLVLAEPDRVWLEGAISPLRAGAPRWDGDVAAGASLEPAQALTEAQAGISASD